LPPKDFQDDIASIRQKIRICAQYPKLEYDEEEIKALQISQRESINAS